MADNKEAQLQHSIIGVQRDEQADFVRTEHPDAQWFLKGGNLGLFIHWGISTVSGEGDLSWGMIDRTPWDEQSGGNYTSKKIQPAEFSSGRVFAEGGRRGVYLCGADDAAS